MSDDRLSDEVARQAALDRYRVVGSSSEASFDRITRLVQQVIGAPVCAVSLIDGDRQWFKSIQGLDAQETKREHAICDHTIRSREAFVVEDAEQDPLFAANPFVVGQPGVRSYAGVPLSSPDGYNVGALCVIDTKPRTFTPEQIDILHSFAKLVMDELELRTLAHRDFLTGAVTRRAFVDACKRAVEARRQSCLAMVDVDHFKRVNDTYGHPAGDTVLQAIARVCEAGLRPNDLFGRLGGEEFAVLLTETGTDQAEAVAERLRQQVAALRFDVSDDLHVTASFGIACLSSEDDAGSWMANADGALYEAKHEGRDRVIVHAG